MSKVIQVADDGTEVSSVEVDDFTVEVLYSAIAVMLRTAAASVARPRVAGSYDLPRQARERRDQILTRIRD